MSQPKWYVLRDENHKWKPHVVPADLANNLEIDLDVRTDGYPRPIWVREPVTEHGMDVGGMCMVDRTVRSVQLDGLKFEVPSQDWEAILDYFRRLKVRHFGEGPDLEYVKAHDRFWCTVLTPAQRDELVRGMEAQRDEADREARADNDEFLRRVDEANRGKTRVLSDRAEAIRAARDPQRNNN